MLYYCSLKTHSYFFSFSLTCIYLLCFLSVDTTVAEADWLVLCLLQIGHYKSSSAVVWASLRWHWQPAGPTHIQEDRVALASSKCLYQKVYRVSNLCSHACRNNTVLSALRRMICSLVVWTLAVQKKPVAILPWVWEFLYLPRAYFQPYIRFIVFIFHVAFVRYVPYHKSPGTETIPRGELKIFKMNCS